MLVNEKKDAGVQEVKSSAKGGSPPNGWRAGASGQFNSFRKGRKLILLDDVTVSVLIERKIAGESLPEPLGIFAAQSKTYRQIHEEIRSAQAERTDRLGALTETTWIGFIPAFLLRMFVRGASRSIYMAKRFGKIGVTAVGQDWRIHYQQLTLPVCF